MSNKGIYVKPWSRQKFLQQIYQNEEVPDIEELVRIVKSFTFGTSNPFFQTMRARALFIIYFLTGGRRTEILHSKGMAGIKKEDIKFDHVDNKPIMFLRIKNHKNKERKTKRLPIPIEFEGKLVDILKEYLDNCPDNKELFNFGGQRATQIINKTTSFNIHFIRHIRATNLVVKYGFTANMLAKFMGWSDTRPAKYYIELNPRHMVREFYKEKR